MNTKMTDNKKKAKKMKRKTKNTSKNNDKKKKKMKEKQKKRINIGKTLAVRTTIRIRQEKEIA